MIYRIAEALANDLTKEAKKRKRRTQEVRNKKDPDAPVKGDAPTTRAESARMLAERGQAGSGRHKNKGMRGKGQRGKGKAQRHPKHRGKSTWSSTKKAGYAPYGARWRIMYNGAHVSREFRTFSEAWRERESSGDAYTVTWLQFDDPDTGDWFTLPAKEFAKMEQKLRLTTHKRRTSNTRKVAYIDYDSWQSDMESVAGGTLSRQLQRDLDAVINFAESEGTEARNLSAALKMIAWDLGYQGSDMRRTLPEILRVAKAYGNLREVQQSYVSGKKASPSDIYASESRVAARRRTPLPRNSDGTVTIRDAWTQRMIRVQPDAKRYVGWADSNTWKIKVREVRAEDVDESYDGPTWGSAGDARREAEEIVEAWRQEEDYERRRTGSTLRTASRKLDSRTRQQANRELTRYGLDGNGRFEKPGLGLSAAFQVLEKYGIEPDGVVSSHRLNGPSGSVNVDLAFSNPEDPFSPEPITNSMLVLSFHELEKYRYEVIAYLS